jgi:hypothetical protein
MGCRIGNKLWMNIHQNYIMIYDSYNIEYYVALHISMLYKLFHLAQMKNNYIYDI